MCIALHTLLVLLINDDLYLCVFSQSEMRLNLVSCLEKDYFTQFLVLHKEKNYKEIGFYQPEHDS